jgi:mono/diheme cytochrome c family protein
MRRFPIGKRRLIFALAALLVALAADAQQEPATFFRQNCMSCHTIGGGRLVGPDLKNVTQRKDRAWLIAFVQNPKAKIDAADPYALKLRDEARGTVMPRVPGMNELQAQTMLAMIDAESKLPKSQFLGLNIGDQPFTNADVQAGYAIFTGARSLTNGGAQCISCHSIAGVGGLGGGQLGPDLTKVFERLQGRKNLAGWLQGPATPTMRPVFLGHPLTNEEIPPLVALFENAAKQPPQPADATQLGFFFLGLGGAIAGLLGADLAWRNRFRGVRKPLVRGEK